MNQQRSRSRERANPYRQQKSQNNERKQQMGNFERGKSNDRTSQQKSFNPMQNTQNLSYQGVNTQFRRSPSPNRLSQQQQSIPPISNSNQQINQTNRVEKLSRQIATRKIQKIEQLEALLKGFKKPFQSSEAVGLQGILQKLSVKYRFEQIYGVFMYFFIYCSCLDENVYRLFYSITSRFSSSIDPLDPNRLSIFYDALIRATLKMTFEEFKELICLVQDVEPQSYFLVRPQVREKLVNQSLYAAIQSSSYVGGESQLGCSIRNVLALIRKAMQRQKFNDRGNQGIHPIRQVLKVLKTMIKSVLKRTFIQNKAQQKQTVGQKTFHLILISQLSVVIHPKYKHHIGAEYEETLNEMTILKMRLVEVRQQLERERRKGVTSELIINSSDRVLSGRQSEDTLRNLQVSYEKMRRQHEKYYLYLLFLLNLSSYNRSNQEQSDFTLFAFFIEPLLEEYRKSSQFLKQKIDENIHNPQKLSFFSSIVKNFGITQHNSTKTQSVKELQVPNLQGLFVQQSYTNILLNTIRYIGKLPKNKTLIDVEGEAIDHKFLTVFSALSQRQTSYGKINQLKRIRERVYYFMNEHNKQLQQKNQDVSVEIGYLIEAGLSKEIERITQLKQRIVQVSVRNTLSQPKGSSEQVKLQLNPTKVVDLQSSTDTVNTQKILQQLLSVLTSMKTCLSRQTYPQLLVYIYLLYKQKKLQYILQSQGQLNRAISGAKLNLRIKENEDKIEEQENKSDGVSKSKDIAYKFKFASRKLEQFKCIENAILQLLKTVINQSLQSNQFIGNILQDLKKVVLLNNYNSLLRAQGISIATFQLFRQQSNQAKQIEALKINSLSSDQSSGSQNIRMDNFSVTKTEIDLLVQQIKKLLALLETKDQGSKIEKLINEKKIQLLRKQIINKTLNSIITKIMEMCQYAKENKFAEVMINVEILLETLLIELFKLNKTSQNLVEGKKINQTKSINRNQKSRNQQNQKQLHLRTALAKEIGINLIDQKRETKDNKTHRTFLDQILSEILAIIHSHLRSSYDDILQQLITDDSTNSQQDSKMIPVQEILVTKIKKCISLFYDKVNDNMIHSFIYNRKVFILRCLTITFYKIKSLSQALLTKYGSFVKVNGVYQSMQMFIFAHSLFFYINDQSLLQPYVRFICNKDRFYLKTELINVKDQLMSSNRVKSQVDKLLEIL